MDTQVMEQAPEASIESRVGNMLFGEPVKKAPPQEAPTPEEQPEEQEATETPEAPVVEETFELELEGEKYVLPKKLEKAVMQERDYTQKSQTVAEQRRQAEFLIEQARIQNFRQAFEAESQAEFQQLAAYDSVLNQPVDWSSMTTDEAFRKKLQLDQWKDEREAVKKSLQLKHQQWEEKTQKALKELSSKADEAIAKRIPNWNADTWKGVSEHAKTDGYTDTELSSITDPRHKLTLWKAQQFDQLKAKATKTVVDVKGVKTTSSNPMPQAVKDKFAFNKALQKTAPGSQERSRVVEQRAGSLFSKR